MNALFFILFTACVFQATVCVSGLKCYKKHCGPNESNCPTKDQIKTCKSGCGVAIYEEPLYRAIEYDCGVPTSNDTTCVDPKDGAFSILCICNKELCNTPELVKKTKLQS